jgi:ubiquinone/menaquinone biosynthesis C-methylase UbiE
MFAVGGAPRIAIALAFTAALTMRGAAQDFMAPSGTPAEAFPKPERPVADIISPIWHSEKERDTAGEPRQLVRLLGIKPGMTVADIGAGSGYYVVRLAPIVGPNGRIIAQDVMPEYLQSLRNRVSDLGLRNVTISLGETHDPRLPIHSLDAAILLHMYHEIAQPYGLLYNLAPALTSGSSTPSRRPRSTVLRQVFCAASLQSSGIARSPSTRSRAATHIWRSSRRRPTKAAHSRAQ